MYNKAQTYLKNHPIGFGFDPDEYAEAVKQDCEANAQYALWKFREEKSMQYASPYAMCMPLFDIVKQAILK